MASSDVEIVNSALVKIGESTITSLTQNNKAARSANRQYPIQRRFLLRKYRWNFAIRRVVLAADATAPAFGYGSRFRHPSNALAILGVFDENEPQANYTSTRRSFKVEAANDGNFILADGDTLPIFYIADVTNVTLFDDMFTEALAWLLASDLAYDLAGGEKQIRLAREGLQEAYKAARLSDAIEGTQEIMQGSEWLDARAGASPLRMGPVGWF